MVFSFFYLFLLTGIQAKKLIGLCMSSPLDSATFRKVIANRAFLHESSYSTLIQNIEKHEVDKIYFSPSNDAVISENREMVDDVLLDYSITKISPSILNSLVEISIKNKVEPVFVTSIAQLNPIQQLAGDIVSGINNLFVPSILLFILINSIRAFFMTRNNNGRPNNLFGTSFPGSLNIDIERDKENMKNSNITLASFAGSPEIFQECTEVVSYLKNDTLYKRAGAVVPRGILLDGPPGTGKTLLAKAIASDADANFISISASEFVEVFVGVGASKIRNLFSTARQNKPCIIFIDEIDAVGRQRGGGMNMANDEREQTLNQLLAEMDGFANNDGLLILAATNRKDVLDKALLRPGRFDRLITVPLPDFFARREILDVHAKNKTFEASVDFDLLADITTGFSGAQLKNLLNEAAIFAARAGEVTITPENVFGALDKLLVGLVRQNDSRLEETKYRVAVHEAGHALLCQHFSDCFELKKVSILSTYNGAGGYTLFNDRKNASSDGLPNKDFLFKRMVVAFGGRAAEAIIFGDDFVSVGASQDFSYANQLAKQSVNLFFLEKEYLLADPQSQEFLSLSERFTNELLANASYVARDVLSGMNITKFTEELMASTTLIF
jgi:cell division protease FtsH